MPGVPRATYMPFPFQIVQGTSEIIIAYPFASASRILHMTDVGESPADAWMGWSRAKWEGDTLVVNVTNQIEDTWFDRAGNFHSEQLNVVEDRKSTRLNSSHLGISYAVFCLKKKKRDMNKEFMDKII